MEKALKMGKTSATGSFQLLLGVASSTIIMAVGAIILGRMLTQAEYGLYGIALAPSILINLFRDWGVNSAMTKYIATLRASDKQAEIHDFMVAGLIFEFVSGVALSFLSFFLATFIASFYQKPQSASYIALVSVSIICGSLLAASQAGFIGYERMELNSFTLVCQAIAKVAVGPILIFLGYSVLGAVVGYDLGFVAAGAIGLAAFYFILLRPLRKNRTRNSSIIKTLRTMLTYGVPLSIGSILAGILAQIYAFMIIPLTSEAMYANYVVAANFTVLLTFFTTPIATVLFPAFAKLDPQTENELVKNVFASSIKYSSILLVPATLALMTLATPAVCTLYGTAKYPYAPFFLTIAIITNLFVAIGSISAGGLLSGLGQTKILMTQYVITLVIGLPLGAVLIPAFQIVGLIIASLVAGLPSMFGVLYWIWKRYETRADFRSSAKILISSATAAFFAYLPTMFLGASNWIKLITGLAVFLIVYILSAPLIGAVSITDINNLRTMFSGLGIVTKIINLPLNVAEKVASARSADKEAVDVL
jgi:O-antigen/teichoic acid export membrane protein